MPHFQVLQLTVPCLGNRLRCDPTVHRDGMPERCLLKLSVGDRCWNEGFVELFAQSLHSVNLLPGKVGQDDVVCG